MLLEDIKDREKVVIKTTKFANIYKVRDDYVVKTISTDFTIPPHNFNREIYILEQLNLKQRERDVRYCIELLEYRDVPANDEIELLFPLYQLTLSEFMKKHYPRTDPASGNKIKFNPYYDAVIGRDDDYDNDNSNSSSSNDHNENDFWVGYHEGTKPKQVKYVNQFDVDRYALEFLRQISSALQFLHENGIIHRDLKPENIVMKESNFHEGEYELVLIDFGISYSRHYKGDNNGETWDHKITDVSTSIYKAPELLFGVQNYAYKIDIWSLMILVSQWFQLETVCPILSSVASASPLLMTAVVDDGTNETGNGSDIWLTTSIFGAFGVPAIDQWEDVKEYGSAEAFSSLFGPSGDGKYILNLTVDEQRSRVSELFPRLVEIKEDIKRNKLIECILGMVSYDSKTRWSSEQLVNAVRDLI